MPYDPDQPDEEDAGLIDQQAIADIILKVQDAIRGIGISFRPEDVQLTVNQGQTYLLFPTVVRPSAKKKLTEDRETKEALNKMLADQHEADIAAQADKIRKMASDPEALVKAFFGDDSDESTETVNACPKGGEHVMHPHDNFCMKCLEGMEK
jgi:hypothetical protein